MKWDEMTPRERDALVAEKVMGVINMEQWNYNYGVYAHYARYTTNISVAWEVVEKMKEGNWVAMRYQTYVWDIFDITPEAICLAALRAVGVEV